MTLDLSSPACGRAVRGRGAPSVFPTGLFMGLSLTAVMAAALFVCTRIPGLERYALARNSFFYGLFLLLALAPVCRFLTSPVRMFAAAMIGWLIFVLAYDVAGMFFTGLFADLRTPGEVLAYGAGAYGLLAAASWVAEMVAHALRHPIASRHRGAHAASRHSR